MKNEIAKRNTRKAGRKTSRQFDFSTLEILFYQIFFKHKQANINVKSRRFGIIMTPFSRQNE